MTKEEDKELAIEQQFLTTKLEPMTKLQKVLMFIEMLLYSVVIFSLFYFLLHSLVVG